MTPYSVFAAYYDELMADVDYAGQAAYLRQAFRRHGLRPHLVLDLACGTGSLSMELVRAGMEVIGVDRSSQMLSQAVRKAGSTNGPAFFVCQDMRKLDLYGTVEAAVCTLDGVNHVTSPADVRRVFAGVSRFLNPGGLFVFDLNTPYKITRVLGDNVFLYDTDRVYCVWQNGLNPRTGLCRFDLTFFERKGDVYRRSDEQFAERAYSTRSIRRMLGQAGRVLEAVYAYPTFDAPAATAERAVYVARKPVDKDGSFGDDGNGNQRECGE